MIYQWNLVVETSTEVLDTANRVQQQSFKQQQVPLVPLILRVAKTTNKKPTTTYQWY